MHFVHFGRQPCICRRPGAAMLGRPLGASDLYSRSHFAFDTCQGIRDQARTHGLDTGFFARLIWQESRFNPFAVSPANARGIAQFIDETAKIRGLRDQFNPSESLEKSAHYLAFLSQEFGNEGLAAVAYNSGERRAAAYLSQGRGLPRETINYVRDHHRAGGRDMARRPTR